MFYHDRAEWGFELTKLHQKSFSFRFRQSVTMHISWIGTRAFENSRVFLSFRTVHN